jgi:hypothetical protein
MHKPLICTFAGAALILAAGSALAQTTTTKPGGATTAAPAKPLAPGVTLTDQQVKSWIGKPVYSSDNKRLGEIAEFKRGADNIVQEMRADIGGFLGMGETRVKLTPQQFKLEGDRAVLNVTQAQAKTLPQVKS